MFKYDVIINNDTLQQSSLRLTAVGASRTNHAETFVVNPEFQLKQGDFD